MTEETMDRRVRKAVEHILEDESLTSGLEDAVAKTLNDWGVAEVERRARLMVNVNAADAQPILDQAVDQVRRTMKQVAKAADAQGFTSPAELTKMLTTTLSQVDAAEAAATAPAPPAVAPAPAAPEPEILLPSAVDLVTPAPPKPEAQGFLTRLRRFFGGG